MTMNYRVKLLNNFTEPYWASDDVEKSPIVEHVCIDEYVCNDYSVMKKILDDFLDAPKKKLTEKDIRKDFDTNRPQKMSAEKVEVVKAYYNGRFDLRKKVYADLAKAMNKVKAGFPVVLKYNIPFEMNYFSCDDNDPCDKLTKMNDAYIEVEVSEEKQNL